MCWILAVFQWQQFTQLKDQKETDIEHFGTDDLIPATLTLTQQTFSYN